MENKKETALKEISVFLERSENREGLFCLKIAEEFAKASERKLSEKFPYDQKPQEAYMDKDGKRILTFNLLEKRLEEKQVYTAIREIQRLISHVYPESIQKQAGCIKIVAGEAGWFSFITGGISEDQSHIMFILPVSERMMLGTYHFPMKEEREERKIFLKMLKSIQIKDTGKEAEIKYAGISI